MVQTSGHFSFCGILYQLIDGYYAGFVEGPWPLIILAIAMIGPTLSAVFCAYLFKEGIKSLPWAPHLRRNRWWFFAWCIPVLFTVGSMALTVFFGPDIHLHTAFKGVEIGPALLFQALILGPLINTPILTFTEEMGWRGYLYRLWRPLGFWKACFAIGLVWGLWHAPAVFLYGLCKSSTHENGDKNSL